MLKYKKISLLLSIILVGMSNYTLAQTCLQQDQYPNEWRTDSDYTNNNDGTITDIKTGLMWMQCSDGLSGATCGTGSVNSYTWPQALAVPATLNGGGGFAGYTDWRLPNVEELNSLSAISCHDPAVNENVFPNTRSIQYWSSSPYANDPAKAWGVHFVAGNNQGISRIATHAVRLVRSGQ